MANKFVWSGATGANNGASWADAYTTLMRDWGAEAGFTPGTDFIYVRSVHSESTGAPLTLTGGSAEGSTLQPRIITVVGDTTGTTPGNLATGASVTTTGANDLEINEGIFVYGVDFTSGAELGIGRSSDGDISLEQCGLSWASGAVLYLGIVSQVGVRITLRGCTYTPLGVTSTIRIGNCRVDILGGTLVNNVNDFIGNADARPYTHWIISGVDLSALTSNLVGAGAGWTAGAHVQISRCVLGAGATIHDQTLDISSALVEVVHCQIGTDSDPAYQMYTATDRGTVETDVSTYRTGGAADGERTNPISWAMDTSVMSKRSYPGHALQSPPIVGWTDGDASTAHTYRIYFASGATQDNDEIWFELLGPNDAATNSLGVFPSAGLLGTRVDPETASAAHTTDGSSTWTGSDVGTKQQMDITYTPDKPGPISAVVYMVSDAGSTGVIHVDPKVYIDP